MTRRVLLVANRTLGSDEVAAAVRERVEAGVTELWIVTPVVAPQGHEARPVGIRASSGELLPDRIKTPNAHSYEQAQERLDDAVARFRRLGIAVRGEVGDVDPFHAVSEVMRRQTFDEVVVSTLPAAVSHWLHVDLPSRVHRKFKVPVNTVASHKR